MGTKSYVPTNEAVEALLIANSNEDYYYFYNSYYILSLIEVTTVAEKRTLFFFDFKVLGFCLLPIPMKTPTTTTATSHP